MSKRAGLCWRMHMCLSRAAKLVQVPCLEGAADYVMLGNMRALCSVSIRAATCMPAFLTVAGAACHDRDAHCGMSVHVCRKDCLCMCIP